MKILIASIGGTVRAVIIMAFGFLFYKWNKNRNEQSPEQHILPEIICYVNFGFFICSVGIGPCQIPNNGLLDFGPKEDVQSNSNSNGL
ncbi:4919_t:CDS:2 [Funneliformis mosseae]|uniref:4919_t:CDS:1 n=1 Tax=Funneliformis mosseae TaxID=27381 RepID=A0A9N9CX39_FUNMO|nr:4919_t:CDS:2 [Funneliformis mosseae]